MANESRSRQSRQPASPQNSATMGVILVVAAVVIAILLFNAGGGSADDTDGDRTAAESANGGTTTSTTIAVATTTPPADLVVVVGNGSGTPGRGTTAAEKLVGLGYAKAVAAESAVVPNTLVYYSPNFELDATALATAMKLSPDRVQPMPATTPLEEPALAAVIIIIGPDVNPDDATFVEAPVVGTN